MKTFFNRYSHWLALCIVAFSFSTSFIKWKGTTPEIIAVVFGGVALIAVAYLTIVVERHKRKANSEK